MAIGIVNAEMGLLMTSSDRVAFLLDGQIVEEGLPRGHKTTHGRPRGVPAMQRWRTKVGLESLLKVL